MTSVDRTPIRAAWAVFWALFLVRAVFVWAAPLVVDETYAIAVAREFSLSFFDHPPVSFWAPVVAAKLTGVEHTAIYRLPSLLFGTISAALIWRIGARLGGERAGLWSLVLYAVAPAFVFAGVFVLPDGPLAAASLFCAYWLVRIIQDTAPPIKWWVYVGLGLAFALASKYQAGLIPIGVVVFALVNKPCRHWFVSAGPWLAALIGLAGLLPLVLWNMGHDWASFTFHTARADSGLNVANFAKMALGQVLYLLPMVAFFASLGIARAITMARTPEQLLLALLALGPILAFNFVFAFSDESFPHWTMPGWLFAVPLGGVALSSARRAKPWLFVTSGPFWAVIVVLVVHAGNGVLTRNVIGELPAWDNTTEAFDYSGLDEALNARGYLDGVQLIAARNWIDGGFMSTGLGGRYPVRILGDDAHHFQFLQHHKNGGKALFLIPSRLSKDVEAEATWLAREFDPEAEVLGTIRLKRGKRDYMQVLVISMHVAPMLEAR